MRLIDADALLKEFMAQTPFGCGTVGIKFVDDLIKNQPTAYDVEAVVAELEKESDRWLESGKAYKDKEEIGVAKGFKLAIEIVRRKE